ncbi:MAG TPA: ThuA domain-containing protein [Chryseosolibacter sp.]
MSFLKKVLKFLLWSILGVSILLGIMVAVFIYKIKNGFPVSYETQIPAIDFPEGKPAVLLFSKTTAFRHGESIDVGKKVFRELASENSWFVYDTEEGGVFNPDQLAKFDVVIFNNSTGRVLNDEQQMALEKYVEQGGTLVGIHGAGDDSHHWDWYESNLIGSKFSHHPIDPQLQEAEIHLKPVADTLMTKGLASEWTHTDEWYVFFENPRKKNFNILYTIDGDKIISNGNVLWIKDKNFGMGKEHPVAWYRTVGNGRTFYTAIGHNASAWQQGPFIQMLENVVRWAHSSR